MLWVPIFPPAVADKVIKNGPVCVCICVSVCLSIWLLFSTLKTIHEMHCVMIVRGYFGQDYWRRGHATGGPSKLRRFHYWYFIAHTLSIWCHALLVSILVQRRQMASWRHAVTSHAWCWMTSYGIRKWSCTGQHIWKSENNFLQPSNLVLWPWLSNSSNILSNTSNGSAVRVLTNRHTDAHRDGTDFILLTADVEGKKRQYIYLSMEFIESPRYLHKAVLSLIPKLSVYFV